MRLLMLLFVSGAVWAAAQPATAGKNEAKEALLRTALRVPAGAPVRIETQDKTSIAGVLEGMTAEGLSVRTLDGGRSAVRQIPFDRIARLKQTGRPKPGGFGLPSMEGPAIRGIPEGAPVTVTLAGKSQVSGRFQGRTAEGLAIQVPAADGTMALRTIPLDQVVGVKQPKGNLKMPGMAALQSPAMVRKSLRGVPVGSPVTLHMPGGRQLDGKLMGMTADGFALQTIEGGSLVTKDLRFDQVASVKPPARGFTGSLPGLRKPGLQTPEALKAQAVKLPVGSPLTVRMPDGSATVGRLMAVNNDGIQLQSMQGAGLVTRSLSFDQIGSMKPGEPKPPSARVKGLSKTFVMMLVTGAVAGALSGIIAR